MIEVGKGTKSGRRRPTHIRLEWQHWCLTSFSILLGVALSLWQSQEHAGIFVGFVNNQQQEKISFRGFERRFYSSNGDNLHLPPPADSSVEMDPHGRKHEKGLLFDRHPAKKEREDRIDGYFSKTLDYTAKRGILNTPDSTTPTSHVEMSFANWKGYKANRTIAFVHVGKSGGISLVSRSEITFE